MQFVDHVIIEIESGKGGNGMVAWRREKYEPFGGPAGGDGGKGGDVILEASSHLSTLLDFKYQHIYKGQDGEKGRNKSQHGAQGEPLVIKVPCGTVVRDADSQLAIADLVEEGQQVLVASGGRGGRGNTRFSSSRQQAPQFCEPGEAGIHRRLALELKLIADVGLVGFPNAGKSTLISAISAAKPKIADYPFTTLTPNLGMVRKPDGDGVLVADIPGLIEGASEGVGLGHDFLRHIERTRLLIHLLDGAEALEHAMAASDDDDTAFAAFIEALWGGFLTIHQELITFSERIAQKPRIVAISKLDTLPGDWSTRAVVALQTKLAAQIASASAWPVRCLSAVTRQGTDELLNTLFIELEKYPAPEAVVEVVPDTIATNHDDSDFTISIGKNPYGSVFIVEGGKIQRLFSVLDEKNRPAVFRTLNILKAMGVFKALKRAGAQDGDTIMIYTMEFGYTDDESQDTPLDLEAMTF